jgi:hypothetical protein
MRIKVELQELSILPPKEYRCAVAVATLFCIPFPHSPPFFLFLFNLHDLAISHAPFTTFHPLAPYAGFF